LNDHGKCESDSLGVIKGAEKVSAGGRKRRGRKRCQEPISRSVCVFTRVFAEESSKIGLYGSREGTPEEIARLCECKTFLNFQGSAAAALPGEPFWPSASPTSARTRSEDALAAASVHLV